jgi:putative oxidoreductase
MPYSTSDPSPTRLNIALLALRIASGLAFLYHGSAILFGAFGGPGPARFAAGHGVPLIVSYLAGPAQFAGGLTILTGFLIRIGAACIISVMFGAILLVHIPHGFGIGHGGMEYALTQMLIAVALLLLGAGDYSLSPLLPASLRKL